MNIRFAKRLFISPFYIFIASQLINQSFMYPRSVKAHTDLSPNEQATACSKLANVAAFGERLKQTCKAYHLGFMTESHATTFLEKDIAQGDNIFNNDSLLELLKKQALDSYYSCKKIMPK